jgi:hypothetical protein
LTVQFCSNNSRRSYTIEISALLFPPSSLHRVHNQKKASGSVFFSGYYMCLIGPE